MINWKKSSATNNSIAKIQNSPKGTNNVVCVKMHTITN